jgi:hypothetical protein
MSKEINDHVKHIANQLSTPALYCQECDHCLEDDCEHCPTCKNEVYTIGALDYISDALDIEYTVSSGGEYLGARVLVAFGGPTIWINTRHNRVEGAWWGDSADFSYVDEMGLDDACREIFECL